MNELTDSLKNIKTNNSLNKIKEKIKNLVLKPSEFQITIYFLIITSIACFIISWVRNNLTVPLGGDYYMQEMTFIYNFYDDFHHFFKTGEFIFFDTSPTLGIDNIGGNAFYGLFSPFNLIMLIFPRNWLLQIQGLEMSLKMVLAGIFFYKYLENFNFSEKSKRIGAIAFAFSGYSFSYLWFHFIDSVCFLPLILSGIEKVISKRDMRVLLVGFFLNGMTNYFFFITYIIGGFFYAVFRLIQTSKTRTRDQNFAALGMGILSFVLGICLSGLTLIPGLAVANSMPRVSNTDSYIQNIKDAQGFSEIFKAIFTFPASHEHNIVSPLLEFLFMNDGCYYANLLNVNWYDNFQASLYATTPMLLLFFVSLIYAFKKKKISYIIAILFNLLLILSPIGYYLFTGFKVGYARFFILPISFMIVFDLIAFENRREIPRFYLDISVIIVLILQGIASYFIIFQVNQNPNNFTNIDWDERMLLIIFQMIYVVVCYVIMRVFFHKKVLNKILPVICSLDVIVMANATLLLHGTMSLSSIAGGQGNISEETKIVELLKNSQKDDQYYRLYSTTADRNNNNINLRIGYNGVSSFHSIYAYQSQDFLDRSRIPYTYHNWSMGVHNHRYNLETFLGVKYYLVDKVEVSNKPYDIYAKNYNIPYGYKNILDIDDEEAKNYDLNNISELKDFLASENCDKALYVNTNYIDTFFVYDNIIASNYLNSSYYEDFNEYSLLRACALEDEDYLKLAADNRFSASSITYNGNKTNFTFSNIDPISYNKYTYYNSLVTRNYVKGNSRPIENYNSSNTKITVYAASWPATTSNPSGEYAFCNVNDPYDNTCKVDYRNEYPFEFANNIGPADKKFDYDTLLDDNNVKQDGSVLYSSKLVIERKDGGLFCEESSIDDPTSGCYISIKSTDNIEWRLFDEEDKLIAIDNPSYSEYKTAHGFYTNRPVKRIVGTYLQGTKNDPNLINFSHRPEIFIQRNYDYQESIDKLKANKVTITSRNNTETNFETNYSKEKIISTNYPYSTAFKVYEKKENMDGTIQYIEQDLIKTQGGFIGFIAAIGKKEYVIRYVSPGFNLGAMLTIIGLISLGASYIFYFLSKKEVDTNKYLLSYTVQEKIKEEHYKYLQFEENYLDDKGI